MRKNLVCGGAPAMILMLVAACASEHATATAPLAESRVAALAPSLARASTVPKHLPGLLWKSEPSSPLSVSRVIGPNGGELRIPQAGVTVIVPAGALAVSQEITMSIHKGAVVAYDFAPHGLTFQTPLTLHQDLSFTNATPALASLLSLGYYENPLQVGTDGADINEDEGGWSSLSRFTFSANVWHFSGYMVACGRDGVI